MELIIEGVIARICKPQEFPSGFRKCEVHVTVEDGKYPQTVALEFLKDDVDEAMGLTVGGPIKARCNVRGREWKNEATGEYRAFMSLVPWTYEIPDEPSIREKAIAESKQNEPAADDMPW